MRSKSSVLSRAALVATLALGALCTPAFAHHSFGRYEMTKSSTIEGTVHKFEWSNPHCWLFVDVVPAAGGAPVTYGFELTSVGEMLRRGWTKTILKPGEKVKVNFRPLRDGSPAGLLVGAEKDGQALGRGPSLPGTQGAGGPGAAPAGASGAVVAPP